MERKVELQVLNITNSQAQAGAFAMLLGEVNGKRQLPIIIGHAEAQSTILFLKGVNTPRPLTHDLFVTTILALGCTILRILIYKAEEGVFFSYIYLKKGEEIIHIDARTSDAIALAVRTECPILIYESILERECIHITEELRKAIEKAEKESENEELDEEEFDEEEELDEQQEDEIPHRIVTKSLEETLAQAIKDENYELAAKIRDRIHSNNKNQ